jgi:hypothetical protein
MALGDDYISVDDFKAYVKIEGSSQYDELLEEAAGSASREVERFCRRQFNDAGSASEREFTPVSSEVLIVDDFSTSDGLEIEVDGIAWTADQYSLEPKNGVMQGVPGWPYWLIRAKGGSSFPTNGADVKVTARWGWAAVPEPVRQATKVIAAMNFQMKDAPLGVAGNGDFGVVRVQDSRTAANKLKAYMREGVLVE